MSSVSFWSLPKGLLEQSSDGGGGGGWSYTSNLLKNQTDTQISGFDDGSL